MAPASIPTALPARAIAGDSWRWDRTIASYSPADGWALTTYLRGAGKLDVAGVAAGSYWQNTALASATKVLPAGQYEWSEFVSSGAERYCVGRGVLTVEPDPASQVAGAAVPFEVRAIAALQAYIAGSLEEGVLEFVIAGRSIRFLEPKEALDTLDRLQERLARKATGKRRVAMVPRFSRVG